MTGSSMSTPPVVPKQASYEQLDIQFAGEFIARLTLSGVDNGKLSYMADLQKISEDQWETLCDTPTFTNDATFIDVATKGVIPAQSIVLIYSSPGWVNVYLRNPTNTIWGFFVELLRSAL